MFKLNYLNITVLKCFNLHGHGSTNLLIVYNILDCMSSDYIPINCLYEYNILHSMSRNYTPINCLYKDNIHTLYVKGLQTN